MIYVDYLDDCNNTHRVTFNSNFDSGNLSDVLPIAQHTVMIETNLITIMEIVYTAYSS